MRKLRLGILISGRGSNMEAIIKACDSPEYPAEIAVILSNKEDATGLITAAKHNITTTVISHTDYGDKQSFEAAMHKVLKEHDVDLVCLAGFMRLVSPWFIDQWPDRMINIHPSLLPHYKGLNTHERVLENGETKTGCTVHYVVPEMDSGPIILQAEIPVQHGDTADRLAARVLKEEHRIYPEAIKTIAENLNIS